ncbi:unnamed protein product [Cochlearia groenlandica]
MAKNSFVILIIVGLIVCLHVSEAQRSSSINIDENALEKDLHEAKNLIEQDLQEKAMNIHNLENEVNMLTKSETMLNELEEASKNGKGVDGFGKRLQKFNRKIRKEPDEESSSSIIQTILKDLGLNGGNN